MIVGMQNERRQYLRYSVNFPVQLFISTPEGGEDFAATALNLSQSGIQLSCNRELITSLLEHGGFPPVCRLVFLRTDDQNMINVQGRLVVNRRIAEDCHHLGFSFTNIDGRLQKKLIEYIKDL